MGPIPTHWELAITSSLNPDRVGSRRVRPPHALGAQPPREIFAHNARISRRLERQRKTVGLIHWLTSFPMFNKFVYFENSSAY